MSEVICWYSSGAASAVATKLMIDEGHKVRIIKAETNSEHPDNERFDREVSAWLGQEIEYRHNGKYHDVDDVIQKTRFIRGPKGARCTTELKKQVNFQVGDLEKVQVFGFTYDIEDTARAERRRASMPEMTMRFPLIEQAYTKQKCFAVLMNAGIDLPVMYRLGFPNNNCIGCLKADSYTYWLNIKEFFPDIYQVRAKQEREVGYAICRIDDQPVFLDELTDYLTNRKKSPGQLVIPSFSCDFLCTG